MGPQRQLSRTLSAWVSRDWILVFFLFLAILGIYYPSLGYPFLNLDDPYYIHYNPYIREFSWEGIYKIFTRPIVHNYFPLQILSYALDYQMWAVVPFGYRLHNVALHILNTALIFLLLNKIFGKVWVSFLAALFFGLHPVNVESVTWVAERKNVLSMAFLLLSLFSYLYYLEAEERVRRRGFYAASLLFFSLAVLAKVSAVVLPPLLFLYDFCFLRRSKGEMVKDKLPFLALAFFFSVLAVWLYRHAGVMAEYQGDSPYATFLAMITVLAEYVIYLIVPVYLDHFYCTPIPSSFWERQVLLSAAAMVLLALLAWRSWRRDRLFFFWAGWFFISLLPVLNIVPLSILRADRYMYLPAVGFFYLIAGGLWKMFSGEYRPFRLPLLLGCSFLVAGTYAYLTVERNRLWRDPIVFWEENLRKFPQSATAYKYIGNTYLHRGKLDLAMSYFQTGLRDNPDNVWLLNGMAMVHKSRNELGKAEEILLHALRLDPKDSGTYNNLGTVYFQKGDLEGARVNLQKALEMDPENGSAHTNLGAIHYQRNQWEEAMREFEKGMALSPGSIEPYLNAALICERKKDWDRAESCLKKGLEYVPDSHAAFFLLARVYFHQGKIPEAKAYLNRAYRLNPQDHDTRYFLNLIAEREAAPPLQDAAAKAPPSSAQDTGSGGPRTSGGRGL